VTGKLVRKDGVYCIEVRNSGSRSTYLVQLVRTEDKNRPLDEHLAGLLGRVVAARGVLRFSPGRTDGPQLGIPIRDESQVGAVKPRGAK
jgi:hypothetical protein